MMSVSVKYNAKFSVKFCFFCILSVTLLAGCGQKGDLYLPDTDAAKKSAVVTGAKTVKDVKAIKKVQK